MNFPEKKALEIATQLTNTRLQNTSISTDKDGGESVVAFFKAVYEGVKEVTKSVHD